MSRPTGPTIITANALMSGEAVYLTVDDRWSPHAGDAALFVEVHVAQARLRFAESQSDVVVGPYPAEAADGPDGPTPLGRREGIRARGPSNYAHGKQAEQV